MAKHHPDADIFCLWNDDLTRFSAARVRESWLSKTPLRSRKILALPLMPSTWRSVDVLPYDWTLVSSHAFAHHIGSPNARAQSDIFVYVHTPARYVWAANHDERGQSAAAQFLSPVLKKLDRRRAGEGPKFAANSEFIRRRIQSSWNQDATVIYPPVHVEKLQSGGRWRDRLSGEDELIFNSLPEIFIFSASRFVAYKRLEVAIQTGEIAQMPVVIAGSGPLLAQLTIAAEKASIAVHIVNRPSDSLLYALYEAAALFVFAAVEDFGIMPVEAMSLGTPVLVTSEGGASESVGILRGGVVVDFASSSDLTRGIEKALDLEMAHAVRAAATQFGELAFTRRLDDWMSASLHPDPSSPPVPTNDDAS